MNRTSHRYFVFETAQGFCGIAWSEAGIARFHLPTSTTEATERSLLRRLIDAEPATPPAEVNAVIEAAKRYFAGERVDCSNVSLDLHGQDEFFLEIYAAARRIGWGQTTTYGWLAKELGAGPEAARDVGQAMAKNPVPLIIPCHRVLAAGGKLGGFSAPGGSSTKQRMLDGRPAGGTTATRAGNAWAVSYTRHVLARGLSDAIAVTDFRCRACRHPPGAEESNDEPSIVFVRRGLFVRRQAGDTVVADSSQILFFNAAQPYRISHPLEGGDDCTILTISPWLAEEVVARHAPRNLDRASALPFRNGRGLAQQPSWRMHYELLATVRSGTQLAIDELLLDRGPHCRGGAERYSGLPVADFTPRPPPHSSQACCDRAGRYDRYQS